MQEKLENNKSFIYLEQFLVSARKESKVIIVFKYASGGSFENKKINVHQILQRVSMFFVPPCNINSITKIQYNMLLRFF